jgi:hypothetical protein
MAKIQMNSVSMGLQQSIGFRKPNISYCFLLLSAAMIKVQGCMQSSVEVMQSMNEYAFTYFPH